MHVLSWPFLIMLARLLYHVSFAALAIVIITQIRIKRLLFEHEIIHSNFEYYYNPLVIAKYIRQRHQAGFKLEWSIRFFILATALIVLNVVLIAIIRIALCFK